MKKHKAKYYTGKVLLILCHTFCLYLLYLYAVIACSTQPNNLLGVPHEPSGMQMLYYVFVMPVLLGLTLIEAAINNLLTKEGAKTSFFPVMVGLSFFLFLSYVDTFDHYRTDLFYLGSLSLFFMFALSNLWILFYEAKGMVWSKFNHLETL